MVIEFLLGNYFQSFPISFQIPNVFVSEKVYDLQYVKILNYVIIEDTILLFSKAKPN